MIRKLTIAALAVCTLWPAVSTAQEPAPRARSRPRVRVEAGPYAFAFDNRGRIGVIVDTHADTTRDKVGARIEAVTPGGPAEKGGLKAGDVITRFSGTALGGAPAEDDHDSGPGMKLIDLARGLDPGDTVKVEYRRGSESRRATLVAEELDGGWALPRRRSPSPGMWRMGPGEFNFSFGGPWGGIELVELNPDLGEYFGAREGLLVVSAPRDSSLTLKGGDVISTIGGRKPSSPTQAMRILRSYDPGDTVSINVLRKRNRVTVTWIVPDEEDHFFKVEPELLRQEPSWFHLMPKMRREIQIPKIEIRDVIKTTRVI